MSWFKTWEGVVTPDWLDELDHVNFLTYQRIADEASMSVWRSAKGAGATGHLLEYVITETYVRYLSELRLGASVEIHTILAAYDTKRFHLIHNIESGGNLACTVETLNLCFDPVTRRVARFQDETIACFAGLVAAPGEAAPQLTITRRSSHA